MIGSFLKKQLRISCNVNIQNLEHKVQLVICQEIKDQRGSTTHKIKVRFIVKQQTLHIHQTGRRKSKRDEQRGALAKPPYKQTSYGTANVHTLNSLECFTICTVFP